VFRTAKQSYDLRHTHWLGLAKASVQVRLTANAYNLRRSLGLFAAAKA
jgi:IS5 family transposase